MLRSISMIVVLAVSFGMTNPVPKSKEQLAEEWVESTFNAMTQQERLGQLFTIRAHSDKGPDHVKEVEDQIKKYAVGGLCFFQGTPEKQAELTNRYQQLSKIPLMISMDAEWGLGMRMKKSTISFPRQLMLGAIQDNRLIYEMGKEVATHCNRLGVHVNFAPVADVNNNPKNPVINTRSFGEDRHNVSIKSYMYMRGMQDNGVMACAKHFPGHGDTDVDSHYDLPSIPHDLSRLDSIELYPFQVLANQGIQSFMVAHLSVPALDSTRNRPTSLSSKVITDLLKKRMNFQGLIFTDGLEMKGVTKHFKPGEVEAEALLAGNDILLLPDNIDASFKAINRYIEEGKLSIDDLNQRVKKVLKAKYDYGLHTFQPIQLNNIRADLNSPRSKELKKKLVRNAITLVNNKDDLLPLKNLNTQISSIAIGVKSGTVFQNTLSNFAPMQHFQVPKKIDPTKFQGLISNLSQSEVVLVSIHDMSSYASKDFGVTKSTKAFIKALSSKTKVVLTVFGSPYSLKYFDDMDWVMTAYAEDDLAQTAAAEALMGVFSTTGRLPVTASPKAKYNKGIITQPIARLAHATPENVGIDGTVLNQGIDELMKRVIDTVASPGGSVLVAKDGKVIFEKTYGYHTYSKRRKVKSTDLYDLASITKIAAGTISIMKLYDEGKIDINQPASVYLPELKGTNKEGVLIKDMMAHIAGLKSWIPFFEETVDKRKKPLEEFYRTVAGSGFEHQVADNLYLRSDFEEEIWQQIYDAPMNTYGRYVYSDLGFYLVAKIVQRVSGRRIDQYVQEEFYQPLGLSSITYNPLQKFSKEQIIPTEDDTYWRQQKVHGYVHDMGAAMLNGVSGHAGLFATAKDLAVIMQLFLNDGYYGGKQYISSETVKLFTQRHPKSTRRGIGFDLFETDLRRNPNYYMKAPWNTFGHLGFTGTCAWADPENKIIYIFLSNRTYPKMNNKKLYSGDFRPRVQEVIYNALIK